MCTEYLHWTRHRAGHWRPGDDNGNSKHSCHTCSVLGTLLSALSAVKRLSLVGTRHTNHWKVCFKCVLVFSQPSWGVVLGRAVPGAPDAELSLRGCVGLTRVLQAEGLRGHRVD